MMHDAWRKRGVKLKETTYNACCMMAGGEWGKITGKYLQYMLHDAWRGRGVKLQESTYNVCCMMPGGEGG